jgi:hypothetical protein
MIFMIFSHHVKFDRSGKERRQNSIEPDEERRSGQERRQLSSGKGYLPAQLTARDADAEFTFTSHRMIVTRPCRMTDESHITITGGQVTKTNQ